MKFQRGRVCNMNYHNISYPDMLNGDGLRVVLWLSGCSHHCSDCQNPQTWNPEGGIEFDKSSEDELLRELSKDYIDGLTLSGGDPLHESNLDSVLELLKKIRILFGNTKTVWLYTGYKWEDITYPFRTAIEKYDEYNRKRRCIIKLCDVLVDGRFENEKKDLSLPFRGSSNQRVIDVNKTILNKTILNKTITLWNCV